MKIPFFKKDKLDLAIERLHKKIEEYEPESEEYCYLTDQLEKLLKAKELGRKRIDPNTILIVAATILQTVIILNYEKLDVIATKSWSHLMKLRG